MSRPLRSSKLCSLSGNLLFVFGLLLIFTLAVSGLTLGFASSVTLPTLEGLKDGSMALPKAACAADACQTVSKIVNGEYRVCKVCCNDAGACQEFCH